MGIFEKRMEKIRAHGSIGNYMLDRADIVENKTFQNNPGYQVGVIYDWDMVEVGSVEFEFEKIKHYYYDREDIEYHVHFRPGYLPEAVLKDRYYRKDGRTRLGMYLDIYNREAKCYEKWIIVAKDDRTSKNRYSVLKCNQVFEWVQDGELKQIVGIVRRAQDGTFKKSSTDKLGGTTIEGDSSIIFPSCQLAQTIELKQRFILSDNFFSPKVYRCESVDDTSTLGVTRFFVKQDLFNPHTDYYGLINEEQEVKFKFPVPVDNLPDGFGGPYHAICDCIADKEPNLEPFQEIRLSTPFDALYIQGDEVPVYIDNYNEAGTYEWKFRIDENEYSAEDLAGYFKIKSAPDHVTVKPISSDIVKYTLEIALWSENTEIDSISLEVRV